MTLEELFKTSSDCQELPSGDNNSSRDRAFWRVVAEMEKRRYAAAKGENERLKAQLKTNKKAFKAVRKQLQLVKSQQREVFIGDNIAAMSLRAELNSGHTHQQVVASMVFTLLEKRANEWMSKFKSVYRQCLPKRDVDQVNVRRISSPAEDVALEFKRTRLVPYSPDRTAHAMWNVMKVGMSEETMSMAQRSDTLMVSEGCVTFEMGGGESWNFKKRFHIPEGFIVVVEAITEWLTRPGSVDEWRHATRESSWEEVMVLTFRKMLEHRHQQVDNTLLSS
ncbi:hypothetical protein PHYSODRAFT_524706 [Phytophthora sojae]|uniref:Uncharacterized protein n=1 Tax=Phytophthora sojae (strain P6497) TaxID=1094619 RepID=G5A6H6_PHYSP|nr:hypothetical protein PHYSODRAFT_524706 [Phytophthora sojae]EGZ08931.1 hypothetical protein PHYSODRAFT_524706 [Phytophthora sojae]|eukprot:XP_009535564.1 hypothetical protein PHYSODRAFT_524706 [Phytophthora sojae]